MQKIVLLLVFLLIGSISYSQVVINEIDVDTPGFDTLEFVELKTDAAFTSLDGYVLVFFNGSSSGMNTSYFNIDLDGYTTDINGLLLIGSNSVSPIPQLLISAGTLQNGPDSVAIYQANDFDFPQGTPATIVGLIDVIIYETNDTSAQALIDIESIIDIFELHPNFTNIVQINEGSNNNTNSIQRFDAGGTVTYSSAIPTPRALNDGSGVDLNGVTISLMQTEYTEGESFDITVTTEANVSSDFNFTLTLDNNTFDNSDFTGTTVLTIPTGQNTISTTFNLIDDAIDEGDEIMIVKLSDVPNTFAKLNDNIEIRIVDNDFVVAPFNSPIGVNLDIVESTQLTNYYNSANGLSDAPLKQALQDIIAEEGVVRAQTYSDVIDILKEADQSPDNSNQVWLLYTEQNRAKLDFQLTSNSSGKWNREHTFPRSRGGFNDIDADDIADGRDVFWNTTADSLRHGNSDAHALRATDGPENSARGNRHYSTGTSSVEYDGPTGNLGSFKGDVARSVLYMTIRYNGLEVVNGLPTATGQLGDLATLLAWHRADPPDDFEMNRNNIIYTWQINRNPLIDHPELVEHLWGNLVGIDWIQPLSINEFEALNINVYPNPATDRIYLSGILEETKVDIFSVDGKQIKSYTLQYDAFIDLKLQNGMYLLTITSKNKSTTKKLVIK